MITKTGRNGYVDKGTVIIERLNTGYLVTVKGDIEMQQDNVNEETHAFEDINHMVDYIKKALKAETGY